MSRNVPRVSRGPYDDLVQEALLHGMNADYEEGGGRRAAASAKTAEQTPQPPPAKSREIQSRFIFHLATAALFVRSCINCSWDNGRQTDRQTGAIEGKLRNAHQIPTMDMGTFGFTTSTGHSFCIYDRKERETKLQSSTTRQAGCLAVAYFLSLSGSNPKGMPVQELCQGYL